MQVPINILTMQVPIKVKFRLPFFSTEINWVYEIVLLVFSLFCYLSLKQGHVPSDVYSVSSFVK